MSPATALKLVESRDTETVRHRQHQTLMSAYQARYIVLPQGSVGAPITDYLDHRYDPTELGRLEAFRPALENRLIGPSAKAAIEDSRGRDFAAYAEATTGGLRAQPENDFIAFLKTSPLREAHYRDFLIQSSADLLAEASASAFGVIGAFGAPQSALFRILIDEFGYGAHDRKHSVLFQSVMRAFGLSDRYDAYRPLFDTTTLELHNTIHWLFQNPRNVFMQAGFLLFAETAYQRSTADHYRYLREFHPEVDARYFGEHAHIDLLHSAMVMDEVAAPFVASYGASAGAEIIAGAELTRRAFARASSHMLAVCNAFEAAFAAGQAWDHAPSIPSLQTVGMTPMSADLLEDQSIRLQVGGLGLVTASAFARFPTGAYALPFAESAAQ